MRVAGPTAWLLLLFSCDEGSHVRPPMGPVTQSDTPPSETPEERPDPLEPLPVACLPVQPACTDLQHVEPLWTLEAAYSWISDLRLIGDANGDGLADASFRVRLDDSAVYQTMVVFGPLVRELVLPRDADIVLDSYDCWFADWNADAALDAVCTVQHPTEAFYWDGGLGFVPGPLPAFVDPEVDRTVVKEAVNWDDLGTLAGGFDVAVPSTSRIDVWRGDPAQWFTAAPDLTLHFPCNDDPGENFADPDVYVCANDADADGIPSIGASLWDLYADCTEYPTYLLPADAAGDIDLATSPVVSRGVCLAPAGDQNLDGIDDYVYGDGIWTGPVDDALTAAPFLEMDPRFGDVDWTGIDYTGDGIDDWFATPAWGEPHPDGVVFLVAGGPTGGLATRTVTWTFAGDPSADGFLTENGENHVLFTDGTSVRFVLVVTGESASR